MLILHLHCRDGRFYLWGERAFQPSAHVSASSPFDPGAEALQQALTAVLQDAVVHEGVAAHLELSLPMIKTASGLRLPLPSQTFLLPEELRDAPSAMPVPLQSWSLSALELPWKTLFALLAAIDDRKCAEGLFVAEEVMVLSELLRYAGALVARGRYLPDISCPADPATSSYEALWSPCLDTEEGLRLQAFAAVLPPVATPRAPATETVYVVEQILREWVDHLVRASVSTTLSLAHAARGRFYSAHDAWFTALRGTSRVIRWPEQKELLSLAEQVRAWRHPVEGSRASGERPAFILHAPHPRTISGCWKSRRCRLEPRSFRNPSYSRSVKPRFSFPRSDRRKCTGISTPHA
jgi:hypothetical protein